MSLLTTFLLLFVILFILIYGMKGLRKKLSVERLKRKDQIRKELKQSLESAQEMRFPLCTVKFSDFKAMGGMVVFERLRSDGLHHTLDTYTEAEEFFRNTGSSKEKTYHLRPVEFAQLLEVARHKNSDTWLNVPDDLLRALAIDSTNIDGFLPGQYRLISVAIAKQDDPDNKDIFNDVTISSLQTMKAKMTKDDVVEVVVELAALLGHTQGSDEPEYRLVFISHQWTSGGKPDHTGSQYQAMMEGIAELGKRMGVADDKILVWADYCSIPQKCKATQQLAISTLAIYATLCSAFLVVAPPCQHQKYKNKLGVESYLSRIWCRMEKLSASVSPSAMMLLVTVGKGLQTLQEAMGEEDRPDHSNDAEIVASSLVVYSGEATCCMLGHRDAKGNKIPCDRDRLKDTMLGLYAMMIYYHDSVPHIADLYKKVHDHHREMMPEEQFPRELMDLFHEEFAPALSDLFESPTEPERPSSWKHDFRAKLEHLLDKIFDDSESKEEDHEARTPQAAGGDPEPKTLANFWKRLDLSGKGGGGGVITTG
jgi:hypothetical protein